jgi:subtilisin family serine protease
VAVLSRRPEVEYAIPDYAYRIDAVPNDPSYAAQWGLARIGAPTAWSRTTGSSSVIVAVLDTGVDLGHPDLQANLVAGWNFVAGSDNPADDNGHGTHVAGIIGAVGNNGVGVAGVTWTAALMPLKVCDAGGSCYLSAEIAALDYAVDHGATIANVSFGGRYGGFQPEQDAIAAAGANGLLFVAAAGNDGADNDADPFYPAGYPLSNIISVGASDASDRLTGFSNFGRTSVDLAAPGDDILSTVPGTYAAFDGTSMAAPFVSGAAALVRALHPSWGAGKVRNRLLGTTAPTSALAGRTATCGRLDVAAATSSKAIKPGLCVTRSGSGLGAVTSVPAGVDCGPTCAARFSAGTTVTLSAAPEAGSAFSGWSGPCSGTGPCTVTLSAMTTISASFRGPATQGGWSNVRLRPPAGRPAIVDGTSAGRYGSFFNVSTSSDGKVRAKTQYTASGNCTFDSTDTGGVFIERKTRSGWASDAVLTSPRVGKDSAARWPNCYGFGSITRLSGDGNTLLVGQEMGILLLNNQWVYRCVAFVYRRGVTGWALDGKLFPPGIGAAGSPGVDGCVYFGQEGAISHDGTRIAMLAAKPPESAGGQWLLRAVVYVRGSNGWAIETNLIQPACERCGELIGPRMLAMSADGTTVLLSDGYGLRFHTFTRSGTTWSAPETVSTPDPNRFIWFGLQLAISADGLTATTSVTDYAQWYVDRGGGMVYVFERGNGEWLRRTTLNTGVPTPEANMHTIGCPAIVRGGRRIVCASFDTVGYNQYQGSVYVFDRPAAGWAAGAAPLRLFSADGLPGDRLGTGGPLWRPTLAVREDATIIDATMNVDNLVYGGYPNDRIGYEFRR